MSIDISLTMNTGYGNYEVIDVGNYTHNCQPMWSHALAAASAVLPGKIFSVPRLCLLDSARTAGEAVLLLERAVAHMDNPANREIYVGMEPSNGWGDFEGARAYLRKVLEACRTHPLCQIYTSC